MKVHYFASVREQLGIDQEEIHEACTTVEELINMLAQRGEIWQRILGSEQTLVAINQQMAQKSDSLTNASEVAFFPYMTGG